MKVKVFVKDYLTGEILRNNQVTTPEFTNLQMQEFHKQFSKKFPNAGVNFIWTPKNANAKQSNFIYGVPLNMEKDERSVDAGEMSDQDYFAKWYGGIFATETLK